MKQAIKIEQRQTSSLIPYARNARTHSEAQVAQIAGSIKEFGFNNPVLIDKDSGIIAGHGRVLAAQKLGLDTVPVIVLGHLTENQKRAYILADNKLALNAGWDEEMLKLELSAVSADGLLLVAGWDEEELTAAIERASASGEKQDELSDAYTKKISIPVYEPKGEKPEIKELYDREKTAKLVSEIKSAGLEKSVADFLILAAERHTSFHFRNIAEFYCHADKKTQDLMEKSGLVIIDFKKAIEYGFVHMTERLGALADLEESENDA